MRDGESPPPTGVELLTGDTNILNVALVVQYAILNPADYPFQVDRPQTLVSTLAESVLTETVVGMAIDEVLTTGRLAIQARVKTKTQETLDRYRSGIQIASVSIMNITLDASVAQAFQDVADAMADREKAAERGARLCQRSDSEGARRGQPDGERAHKTTSSSASPKPSATPPVSWPCSRSTRRRRT